MVIFNNMAAMSALNETNRNTSKLEKTIRQATSGMKINSAGDDASGYSISERMKVRIRALNQNDENVKKGESLLKIAEGAIQSQMNLLKTVKERVINAHNDSNTEADRAIIQKEIDQCYEQMSSIAYDTDFDGKKLLVGNKVEEKIISWIVNDTAVLAEDSDIPGLLHDATYGDLDGEPGPFAIFGSFYDGDYKDSSVYYSTPYDGYNTYIYTDPTSELLGTSANTGTNPDRMWGGTAGTQNVTDISLAGYSNVADLDDKSFRLTTSYMSYDFVLTTDTTKKYRDSEYLIDLNACSTVDDVAARIAAKINGSLSSYFTAASSGKTVTFTTKDDGAVSNNYTAVDWPASGGTTNIPGRAKADNTGLSIGNFSGGADAVYKTVYRPDPNDPDLQVPVSVLDVPAKKAKLEINGINTVASGSGITISGVWLDHRSYSPAYLAFVDGSSGLSYDAAKGCNTIGKDYTGSFSIGCLDCTMSGGKLTAVAKNACAAGNSITIHDGIAEVPSQVINYTATTGIGGITNHASGSDGNTAHWDINLSGCTLDDVIDSYLGKSILVKYTGPPYQSDEYEFIDTGASDAMDGLWTISNKVIDFNDVRTAVNGGQTVEEAFAKLVQSKFGAAHTNLLQDAGGNTKGISFLDTNSGVVGNSAQIIVRSGELRSYAIDWKQWATSQGITDIPAALNEKGFRFYCPTDSSQWVNVRFIDGLNHEEDDRPESGTEVLDIKTVTIDIQGIDTVESLVSKIDNDLGSYLANTYKHNLLLASDSVNGLTTIYDKRRKHVKNNSGYDNQAFGAKIATGVMDNVVKDTRNVYVNELNIQHADKASVNIQIKIPQTTMDHIFGYKEGTYHITDYNVLDSKMREKLLGHPPEKGILDTGLEYLTDAETLIGAQINHMRMADNNITTQSENVTSSCSVLQDADIARVAMEQAKYNLLQQASQSMLAQANQTPNGVLGLLQ